jgi:type I restriction enzyme S subunit
MENDWKVVALGEYCLKIGSGATPRGGSSVYKDSGEICLIRSQNIYNDGFKPKGIVFIEEEAAKKLKNVVVHENDILLNITGDSVARVCLAISDYLPARVNQHVAIIRPNPKEFDARYLRYVLSSPYMQKVLLNLASAGATRHALTKTMIETFEVSKPPLEIQAAVADNLQSFDDKILLNGQTNQTLEQMAQTLFNSWFVDFDPVFDNLLTKVDFKLENLASDFPESLLKRAKTRLLALDDKAKLALETGTQSTYPQTPLHKEIAEQPQTNIHKHFPSEFEHNDLLGWIPKGWGEYELGDCIDVLETGRRPKGGVAKYKTGMPSVGAESINGVGNFNFGKLKFVPTEFYLKMKAGKVQDYDVLLYKDGGKPGEFKPRLGMYGKGFPFKDFGINEHVFRIRSKKLGQFFLYFQLGSERVFYNLSVRGGKAAIPGVNQNDVKQQVFLVPDVKILDVFNTYIESNFEKILLTSLESLQLSKLRDTLLPKLISGELTIPTEEE